MLNRRELLVLGGLLGVGGGATIAIRLWRPIGRDAGDTPVTRSVWAEPAPVSGNPQGRLQMALFSDYNCGACRAGHAALLAAVKEDGDVRIHHLEWPIFGDDSRDAARIALASDAQGIYPAVNDRLMQGPRATLQTAYNAVAAAGGSLEKLALALAEQGPAIDGRLARYAFHAFSLGLRGTPSFLVGTRLAEGAQTTREWRRLFRQARG